MWTERRQRRPAILVVLLRRQVLDPSVFEAYASARAADPSCAVDVSEQALQEAGEPPTRVHSFLTRHAPAAPQVRAAAPESKKRKR